MGKLLRIEWMKIKGYRTFWVLTTLFLISIVGINFSAYYLKQETTQNNAQVNMIMGAPFSFPNVWHTVSYLSAFLLFIPGLIIITSVTNEYTYKTTRQNIIDGWSRKQFIHVKIALVILLSAISSVVVFLTAVLFGSISEGHFSLLNIEFIGYYFIQALSYSMVALILSLLIKRSGFAIGIFFIYAGIIENVLGAFLNYKTSGMGSFKGLGNYLPLNTTDNLIPFPFFRQVVKFGTDSPVYVLLTLSMIYLFLYYVFSVRKFQNDDL
ncbi:MAG: ABC transporter permease [Ginsengibacter sp.]